MTHSMVDGTAHADVCECHVVASHEGEVASGYRGRSRPSKHHSLRAPQLLAECWPAATKHLMALPTRACRSLSKNLWLPILARSDHRGPDHDASVQDSARWRWWRKCTPNRSPALGCAPLLRLHHPLAPRCRGQHKWQRLAPFSSGICPGWHRVS